MEGIKKELAVMETVELQLLGSLHKLQSGNNQGLKDIDTIASRIKASCKSVRAKLDVVERRMVNGKKKRNRIATGVGQSEGVQHET